MGLWMGLEEEGVGCHYVMYGSMEFQRCQCCISLSLGKSQIDYEKYPVASQYNLKRYVVCQILVNY